jgi:acyl carrier protein
MQLYTEEDLSKIRGILYQFLSQEAVGDDANIYEAGLTSVMVLPFLSEVESAFGLSIPDTDFLDAHTPKELAQLVRRLRTE